MPQGQGYDSPEQLPIVERCAKKVVNNSDKSKDEAIPICIRSLRESGRIAQNDQGMWVQRKQKQPKGATGGRR